MKHLNTFRKFSSNEEINWKKALLGGAIASSTLTACDDTEINKIKSSPWHDTNTSVKVDVNPIELPNKFEIDEVMVSIGTDMNINVGGNTIGKIEERTLEFTTTFEYFDNTDRKIAKGEERAFSWGTTIDIFDESDRKIGTLEEQLFESVFSIETIYDIKDANGRLIAKSKKIDLFSTNVEIFSTKGNLVCTMTRPSINVFSDSWYVEILGDIDKRLIIFIPAYKTSADNKRK